MVINHKRIVPLHKSDMVAIANLSKANSNEIIAEASNLLMWLQDGNWPVAHDIAKVLAKYTNKIKYELIDVLTSDDESWKYWCICGVIDKTESTHLAPEILSELERLANSQAIGEAEDSLAEIAAAVLTEWKYK